ncbi:DUF2973 domain-containing protein [Prochlorococcus sp. MIT 1307]|uniref:DUF2973 domain-containing protein n=1 Tax=Prochlorococcus sp. MIT 1307 TaxID=3096219 RepID=UPI002A7658B4|nr:DUF2973 domain-containing protein [Prochlorococcus sp. MIT 1307]
MYLAAVLLLLWQAFRVMRRVFWADQRLSNSSLQKSNLKEDRTGRLTIHPELLDQDGKITDEELLTVRFSGDIDPPKSAETSAE